MIAVDTNILLRAFVEDENVEQAELARAVLEREAEQGGIWVTAIVLAETVWVMRRHLKYSKETVTGLIRLLLISPDFGLECENELSEHVYSKGEPVDDIADYLIAISALKAGCTKTLTFDKRAAKNVPGMELLT